MTEGHYASDSTSVQDTTFEEVTSMGSVSIKEPTNSSSTIEDFMSTSKMNESTKTDNTMPSVSFTDPFKATFATSTSTASLFAFPT